VPNEVAVRPQVVITGCRAVRGGWEAIGQATNPGQSPVDYHITVFFTTPHATVLAAAATSVLVPPGQSGRWKAAQTFAAVAGTSCVLRGVAAGS
jgi:hypothetical protein